jgi:nucleoside-diphosphate-sugar epimerase
MGFSVFLIGPGFIGGEVLDLILSENKYTITTLVRRESAVADLEKLGVKAVIGTLDDSQVITNQVAVSDIVLHTATADHLPSVQAVIDGVKQREKKGLQTIYIHTSGASLIGDNSEGNYKSDTVFDDENPAQIDALPDSAPHRLIDLAIVRARKELAGHSKMAIMIPPLIYGVSSREKRLSIQLPTITRYSLKHGYAGQVGKGLSVWSHVHVKDLARAYVILLHWMERTSTAEVLQNPYFFCENGQELSWGECSAQIGRILQKAGCFDEPEPKTISSAKYDDIFGDYTPVVAGSNSRNRANRLRKLGWAPSEKGTFASLAEDEIPLILKEDRVFSGYSKPVAS